MGIAFTLLAILGFGILFIGWRDEKRATHAEARGGASIVQAIGWIVLGLALIVGFVWALVT